MDEQTFGMLVMIFAVALPCILFGYLIAVKQKRGLIAGWDEFKASNPEAFAKLVGQSVMFMGVLIGIIALAWYCGLLGPIGLTIATLVVSLIPLLCVIIANLKYGKKET